VPKTTVFELLGTHACFFVYARINNEIEECILWTLAIFTAAMCGIRRKFGELNPTQGSPAEFEFLKTPCFSSIFKRQKWLNPTILIP
jgi:hypothetical protein